MLDQKIKCCSLFESFVKRYRDVLGLELSQLGEAYVLEVKGQLHVEDKGRQVSQDCGGCISCGPSKPASAEPGWRIVPFESVWKACPFCGGGFVRKEG